MDFADNRAVWDLKLSIFTTQKSSHPITVITFADIAQGDAYSASECTRIVPPRDHHITAMIGILRTSFARISLQKH